MQSPRAMRPAPCSWSRTTDYGLSQSYGNRTVGPKAEPMTLDTIFDLASLTKVIATTTCVMRLEQLGQIKLNDPVAKYIPDFAQNGKEDVTIRMLLTHYSGLPADLDLKQPWSGLEEGYARANASKLVNAPGSTFLYSDVGFIVLGELVQKVGGMPLDQYAQTYIFGPLGMSSTRFNPPPTWVPRIAPTQRDDHTGQTLRGTVHDPTARQMGGVAGDAGLFSNADDVAKFAQTLLNGGAPILNPLIVEKMTTPQQPANYPNVRGLGWDIDSPYSSNRGELLPVGSFGHTGFTGTSLWIDPTTNTYVILLTNAVHVEERQRHCSANRNCYRCRSRVASESRRKTKGATGTHYRLQRNGDGGTADSVSRNGKIFMGIDMLEERKFDPLHIANVTKPPIGLVTNQTGIDSRGRRTIDVLSRPGVQLAAIFSPEHGAQGTADTTDIANSKDRATGVPFTASMATPMPSGARRRGYSPPRRHRLRLQDMGTRFYTYETTLGYFLEAAAKAKKPIIVLDRPNPITGNYVQGRCLDTGRKVS